MEKFEIETMLDLSMSLQNLLEGFDPLDANKKCLITAKTKILFEIYKKGKVNPATLINKIGLAKSNLAIICNSLIKEKLIEKNKTEKDQREIKYCLTQNGERYVEEQLDLFAKNVERVLAYKNNHGQVNETSKELLDIINIC